MKQPVREIGGIKELGCIAMEINMILPDEDEHDNQKGPEDRALENT